jgi:hypothetical protein
MLSLLGSIFLLISVGVLFVNLRFQKLLNSISDKPAQMKKKDIIVPIALGVVGLLMIFA